MHKNVLFCILVIIVGLLFSLPFLDGIVVKQKFVSLLQAINNQHLQIKLLRYHRGWFASTAIVSVKLPKEKVSSRLSLNIHHGPLISASASQPVTKLAWAFFNINATFETPTLKKYLPTRRSAKACAYWYFNSQLAGDLQVEKVSIPEYRHTISIIWPGVTTKFYYSLSTQKWSFNGIIGGVNIRWLHNNVNVSPVLFSSSGRMYLQHQWLGKLQMHAPLIIWKKDDTTKFLAQNINFSCVHNAASRQRLNYIDKLDIAMLNYQKYRYAPLQFEGIGNNLTVNALAKQHKLTSQWWVSVWEQHAILQPSNWISRAQQLISAYKKILIQGGSIHNQGTMQTSLGTMRFNLIAKQPVTKKGKSKIPFSLNMQLQLPKPLAKLAIYNTYQYFSPLTKKLSLWQAEILTNNLIKYYKAMGLFRRTTHYYNIEWNYQNRKLKIDGMTKKVNPLQGIPLEPGPVILSNNSFNP